LILVTQIHLGFAMTERQEKLQKYYNLNIFLDISEMMERCGLISRFTAGEVSAATTTFFVHNDTLVRETEILPGAKKAKHIQICEIQDLVSRMHAFGIIHGDICPKNILSDGFAWLLTDFEPALRVIKNSRPILMGTPGYLDPNDVAGGRISQRTDFYALKKIEKTILPACRSKRAQLQKFTNSGLI
jgi:serine/threonine protein kinase